MTSSKMNYQEIKEIADRYDYLSPAQSVRENHNTDSCVGDSKSLQITLGEDDGILRAYCHRCGAFGSYRVTHYPQFTKARKNGYGKHAKATAKSTVHIGSTQLPSGCIGDTFEWAPHARAWIGRAGITAEECVDYGLMYNPRNNTVVIPSSYDGDMVGYQIRSFNPDYPKYTTKTHNKKKMVFRSKLLSGTDVVIVEDALSAIKVGRIVPAVALQGVNLSTEILRILKSYKRFFIWLDNDNGIVKMRQQELATRLSLFGEVVVVKTDKDPKEYSDEDIRRVLGIQG